MIALAAVAFVVGAIFGAGHRYSPAQDLASQFVQAWTKSDYATMYTDIDAASQRRISPSGFAAANQAAATTATTSHTTVAGSPTSVGNGIVVVPVDVTTRLFGTLRTSFRLKVVTGTRGPRVAWSQALVFPGLRPGETLTRLTTMPPRATLLARDGSVLASGPAVGAGMRSSPLGAAADAVVGEIGPIPTTSLPGLEAQGLPSDAIVGESGLELALDGRLRGRPGGELLAGGRVLASVVAKASAPVRTTISPAVQRAAVSALGGQLGGIVAMDPTTGQILAVAGIGINDLQPPGSTFKMVTVTGVLQAKIANAGTVFPYATHTTLDGVKLENASGESCGGSLELAFAVSCNSVFAPLGVRLGAGRLVATAERFGFNHDPGVPGAVESTLPPASEIEGELALGSTAIGQGQVLSSALEMVTVASTIANGGRRPTPTFVYSTAGTGSGTRVMSPEVARTVRRLMIAVVRIGSGTGTAAAIPGVVVAGKTGTAELGTPRCQGKNTPGSGTEAGSNGEAPSSEAPSSEEPEAKSGSEGPSGCHAATNNPRNTDAWFAAFAPALHPRVAVAVLLVRDGYGGETAAPVARQVLEAALETHTGG